MDHVLIIDDGRDKGDDQAARTAGLGMARAIIQVLEREKRADRQTCSREPDESGGRSEAHPRTHLMAASGRRQTHTLRVDPYLTQLRPDPLDPPSR